jgi:hypothetical protein
MRERIIELLNEGITNQTEMARIIAAETGKTNIETIRKNICNKMISMKTNGVLEVAAQNGIDPNNISSYWYKSEHYSINVKNKSEPFVYSAFKEDFLELAKSLAPKHIAIKRKESTESYCLLIDPADIHINKLCSVFEGGVEYNSQIAVARVKEGVQGILDKAKGFHIDKIILLVGNDVLNTDNIKNQTTKGTEQQTHLHWFDAFVMAKQMYIDIISTLVKIADLEIVYNVSNHDQMSGFFLMDSLYSWYHKHKNIEFNRSPSHRKYSVYGKNLIGTTHGDGAKQADLPMLMVHEASEHWHECVHRYIFGHHIHHKVSKDYMSVQFESLRSPSPADSWHHKMGYQHTPLAIEGFLFHKEHGQIARLTNIF